MRVRQDLWWKIKINYDKVCFSPVHNATDSSLMLCLLSNPFHLLPYRIKLKLFVLTYEIKK